MGISYAPFDDPVAPKPPTYIPRAMTQQTIQRDGTECNYLIMAFIAGVFLMSLVDSIRG
jgi:hypothetical protein